VRVRVPDKGAPTVEVHDVGVGAEPARLYEHVYHGAIQPPAAALAGGQGPDAGLTAVKAILDAHHASVALCDGPAATGTALPCALSCTLGTDGRRERARYHLDARPNLEVPAGWSARVDTATTRASPLRRSG